MQDSIYDESEAQGLNRQDSQSRFEVIDGRHSEEIDLEERINSLSNERQASELVHESGTDTKPAQQIPKEVEKKSKPASRRDQKCKTLPQNIGSTLDTLVPKIVNGGSSGTKEGLKELKGKFKKFLDQHSAKNSQLVILFAYFFMLKQNSSTEQFLKVDREMTGYLNRKLSECQNQEEEDKEQLYEEKVNINKRLVAKYFDGNRQALDFDEVRHLCSGLFTGRQKKRINQPLETLRKLQQELLREETEILSKSESQLIQSFLELSRNE